jgi:AraC-like DNA-binding protein
MPEPSLEYRDYSSLKLDLAWIYTGVVPELFREINFHADFMGAWLILEGEVELTQQGKTVLAYPGEWLIVRKAAGTQRFAKGSRIRSIRFQAEWPDGQPFFHEGLSTKVLAQNYPELEKTSIELLEYIQSTGIKANSEFRLNSILFKNFICIRSLFQKWFLNLHYCLNDHGVKHSRSSIKEKVVLEVLRHLDRISLDSKPKMSQLAQEAGVSLKDLNFLFKAEIGVTPKKYFLNRRLSACRQLLAFSELPIKEIAYDLGFNRLSDFSAWVRSNKGVSPREYRAKSRVSDSRALRLTGFPEQSVSMGDFSGS